MVELSQIYQNYFLRKDIFREQFNNGYKALDCFLSNYAYERQGAAAAYPQIAHECISIRYTEGNAWRAPTIEDAIHLWENYQNIAKQQFNLVEKKTKTGEEKAKVNRLRNPMNKDKGVIVMIASKSIPNIAVHVRDLLNSRNTFNAYTFLKSIRGIGDKISSFYLRDIACLAGLDEENISDLHLLQPIDTWLEQTIEILFNSYAPISLEKKQKLIIKLCKESNVSSIYFNQGAWVLGSQIAIEFETFRRVLDDHDSTLSIIEKHIEDRKRYLLEIENVLETLQSITNC